MVKLEKNETSRRGGVAQALDEGVKMESTAESVRETGLDKFYTIPAISEKCLTSIGSQYKWSEWGLVIEPSAGNGSFLTRIPTNKKMGIDISPEHTDIIKSVAISKDN